MRHTAQPPPYDVAIMADAPTTVPRSRDLRWMLVFLAAALALGATTWRVSGQRAGLIPAAQRESTPDMTLPLLDGGQWRLSGHRGSVVLMNFWATWCEPCRDELPGLKQIVARSGAGLEMVAVAMDTSADAPARVREYAAVYRLPWAIAFPDQMLRARADGIGLPTTVLLDKQGRRAKTYVGEVDRATLQQDVDALLAEH